MNKKLKMNQISYRSKSNKNFTSNLDSENMEETEKTSRKKSKIKRKKTKSKPKKKKRIKSCKGIVKMPNFPNLQKIEIKLEEKKEIEFVLGDFNDFHSLNEITTFKNMTSLTLINESIKDISLLIENIPNPKIITFLCLNQNEIDNLNGIEKLENIEILHVNFNYIETIPTFFKTLKKLHTFWISENNISILENFPLEIKNIWIANNEIENIPENFDELINLEILNISGNFINDLKDLFILGKIKKLKRIYLSDINFGENPICQFNDYRKIMVHIFNYVEVIDQIKLTEKEKKEVEKYYNDNKIINNDKIKQNYKICKKIFKLMNTFKFFYSSLEFYKLKVLSLQLKKLEYNLYETIYFNNNDIDINLINNEIKSIKKEIDINLSNCENIKNRFYKLKDNIMKLNDLSIVFNFYELETNNNIKIEPGNLKYKWTKSCINLMKNQLPEEFLKKYKIEGISINQIYKIKDKKSKLIFNALYDDLMEEYNKLGEDKPFFKYLYILLPDEIIKNKKKLFQFLFENNNEEENFFFCDNYSYLDEFKIKKNNEVYIDNSLINNYVSIFYKCSYFENNMEVIDGRFNFFSSLDEIKNYLINLKSNSSKDIVCLKIKKNVNFYYYTNRGLIQPKYIIEYNYKTLYGLKYISSFEKSHSFNEEYEKLFNTCSTDLFNLNRNRIGIYINNGIINKYYLSNFFEYKEIDNNILFFIKNHLFNYLNDCFQYKNKEEYFNEVIKLDKSINEINHFTIKNNYLEIYDYVLSNINNEKEKNISENKEINNIIQNNKNISDISSLSHLKSINLFNNNLTDKDIKEFLNKLKRDKLQYTEIQDMTQICEELILSKNNLIKIDLSEILNIFPNLNKLDLSFNNLTNIEYINNNSIEINQISIKILDISFNNIEDFNVVIKLLEHFTFVQFIYYANPFERKFEKLINYQNCIINNDIKELLQKYEEISNNHQKHKSNLKIGEDLNIKKITKLFDYIYNSYSFNDLFRIFNDCIYFYDTIKYDNESQINIVYLNKKHLVNIPIIEGSHNIQIIYLNSNKIIKITNLSQLNNLKEIFLQNNKIKIIENLPTTLKKLDISNNYINDLTGIEKLLNLNWINLENNKIKNISPLIKLINLIELNCSNNLINSFNDYNQLGKLKNLEIFDISGNEVINNIINFRITIIYYCPNLTFLNRHFVDKKEKIASLEYFNGKLTTEILEKRLGENRNSNLIEINLSSLKLKDEMYLFSEKQYPKLKKLNLSKNNFKSFIIFGQLPELIELDLSYNYFSELFPQKKKNNNEKMNFNIKNLLYLDMSGNKLSDLNGIEYFSKLQKINVKENSITKIDSLDKMNQLNYINISFNKLRNCDKTNIGILPVLKIFLCDNNYLKNINCFEKFYSLEIISFNNNKITDLGCLEKLNQLKKLTQLSIINNPITKIANYRKIIIKTFPHLQILDNKEICQDERIINSYKYDNNISYFDNYNKNDESFGTLYNYNNNSNNNINININNNINNNISLFKNQKRVNYVQIGYNCYPFKNNRLFSYSQQKDEIRKKIKDKSHIEMNEKKIQNRKNNDFNWGIILSNRNKINSHLFPKIKKSNTIIKNKNNVSKIKYHFNSKNKINGSVILTNEKQQNKIYMRPQSTARITNSHHKCNPSIFNNQDYFSIVLNSVNNDNCNQLITLKNWNIRKINFDLKK